MPTLPMDSSQGEIDAYCDYQDVRDYGEWQSPTSNYRGARSNDCGCAQAARDALAEVRRLQNVVERLMIDNASLHSDLDWERIKNIAPTEKHAVKASAEK